MRPWEEYHRLWDEYQQESGEYLDRYGMYLCIKGLCWFVFSVSAPIAWMHAFPPAGSLFDKMPLSFYGHLAFYLLVPVALAALAGAVYAGVQMYRMKSPSTSKIRRWLANGGNEP